MTEVKHTPSPSETPWKVVTEGFKNGFSSIETVDGGYEVVLSCRQDNATFIVQACNSHDDLVKALVKIQTISAHMQSKRSFDVNKIASDVLAKIGAQ